MKPAAAAGIKPWWAINVPVGAEAITAAAGAFVDHNLQRAHQHAAERVGEQFSVWKNCTEHQLPTMW